MNKHCFITMMNYRFLAAFPFLKTLLLSHLDIFGMKLFNICTKKEY